MIDILLIIVGLSGLFFGGEMFVRSASQMARQFGISMLVIGLTVVAVGTSTPELIVSVGAALEGSSDIALGNVVGSNIINIGLIAGLAALIMPFAVHVRMLRQEIPIMLGVTLIAYVLMLDQVLSRTDGILLLMGAAGYFTWMIVSSRQVQVEADTSQDSQDETINPRREVLFLVIGLVLLLAGARFTVNGAVNIATAIGLSELVIGMTLVAVGTSLPELVTSVVAARRGESDIALGNVVGSNIANLLVILGMTAVIQPIPVDQDVIQLDALVMIGFALLLIPFAFNRHISRREGLAFVTAYIAYTVFLLIGR